MLAPLLVFSTWLLGFGLAHGNESCESFLVQRPYLYVAEKDGRETYLLGTLHQGVPLHHFPTWALDYLVRSEVIVTEYRPARTTLQMWWVNLIEQIFLFRGSEVKAKEVLSAEAYKALLENLSAEKIDPEVGKSLTLAGAFYYSLGQGGDPEAEGHLDHELVKHAVSCGLETKGLESTPYRFRQIAKACTVEYVEKSLLYSRDEKSVVDHRQMIHDYKQGTEGYLLWLARDNQREPDVNGPLIDERNLAWMSQILKYHESPKVHFIAAGLAHFSGPLGLLALLKDYGFSIRRVQKP